MGRPISGRPSRDARVWRCFEAKHRNPGRYLLGWHVRETGPFLPSFLDSISTFFFQFSVLFLLLLYVRFSISFSFHFFIFCAFTFSLLFFTCYNFMHSFLFLLISNFFAVPFFLVKFFVCHVSQVFCFFRSLLFQFLIMVLFSPCVTRFLRIWRVENKLCV